MHKFRYLLTAVTLYPLALLSLAKADTFGLETMQLQHVQQDWGEPHANRSVDGHPLQLGGKHFEHG